MVTQTRFRLFKYWIPKYLDRKLVVVTHHLPSFMLIPSKYVESPINHAFANDLESYLSGEWSPPMGQPTPKYWIAGHSHGNRELEFNHWKLLLNACGCPDEHPGYDWEKTIP